MEVLLHVFGHVGKTSLQERSHERVSYAEVDLRSLRGGRKVFWLFLSCLTKSHYVLNIIKEKKFLVQILGNFANRPK